MKDDDYILDGSYVLRMRIELDKKKIDKKGLYDYPTLIERLDNIAKQFGLEVLESGHFYGNKGDMMTCYDNIGVSMMIFYLGQCEWFATNVKSWEKAISNEQGVYKYSKLV